MTLIPNANQALKFGSVQAALLLAVLSGVQADVLPLVQPLFSPELWPVVSGALALAIVVLRLLAQPGLEAERELDATRQRLDAARASFEAELDAHPQATPNTKQPGEPL